MSVYRPAEIGRTFGRLTIVNEIDNQRPKRSVCCECSCGSVREYQLQDIRSGHTQSCGCLKLERFRHATTKHGMVGTKIYELWTNMRNRCRHKSRPDYKYYGGRGIKVCKKWDSFAAFYKDMGDVPEGMTLDRKNTNGHYCKSNCKWATRRDQMNNIRNNVRITALGDTKTLTQWADDPRCNMTRSGMKARLRRGWRGPEIVTTRNTKK